MLDLLKKKKNKKTKTTVCQTKTGMKKAITAFMKNLRLSG
jgi:hypothetical protein